MRSLNASCMYFRFCLHSTHGARFSSNLFTQDFNFLNQWPTDTSTFDPQIDGISSNLQCAYLCQNRPPCVSFFYDDVDKLCMTSSGKYEAGNLSTVERNGSVFYSIASKANHIFIIYKCMKGNEMDIYVPPNIYSISYGRGV